MAADLRASGLDLRRACDRLIRRGVLTLQKSGAGFVVALPIFREWLGENALSKLLPLWTTHASATPREQADSEDTTFESVDSSVFPISEDDLLAVAQGLVYCGKQKDVADIRLWLRQFDDDGRIEIAFQLLRRVAERGFINEGRELSDCRSWRRWSTRDGATSDPVFGKLFAIAVITWHWVTSIPSIRAARRQRETCRRVCGLENVRLPSN